MKKKIPSRNEESKVSLTLGPIINYNSKKKYFSLKECRNKKKLTNKNKKLQKRNFHNFIQTTVNNIPNKNSMKLLFNIKNAHNMNKLFSIKVNDKKNCKLFSRNSFRDFLYFNKNDKKRIYKTYFSVNKNKNENNKNTVKYFQTLNNCNSKNTLKQKIIINSYNINNKQIQIKKNLLLRINKYKNKINQLKKTNNILQKKINSIKEENDKIQTEINKENNISNKEFILKIINLIKSLNNNNLNNIKINNISFDITKFLLGLTNEYNDKIKINDIIDSLKKLYLEYNYCFTSKETKKIINFNDISYKILWNWIKIIPKLIFYEKIKNNLDKNKTNYKNYEVFIQYLFALFGVDTIKELNLFLEKLVKNK